MLRFFRWQPAGSPVQLTAGPAAARSPVWSPDSSHVAFIARRMGDTTAQIYIIASSGGEAQRLTDGEVEGVGSLTCWSADGHIYFSGQAAPKPEAKPTRFKVPSSDSPYAFEAPGFLTQTLVCRVPASLGLPDPPAIELLTPEDCTASSHCK